MARTMQQLARNPVSLVGALLAISALGGLVLFFGVEVMGVSHNPYLGVVIYVLLPTIVLAGVAIVVAGMYWEARRRRRAAERGEPVGRSLQIDLGNPRHLRGVVLASIGGVAVLGLMGSSGYQAMHFMESPTFCGTICHTPMQPEYEQHRQQAHAEVECTECHIGPGATFYLQSKVNGAKQMLAVVTDSYERPIETPILHLRPAADTCEGCHWREAQYGMFLKVFREYLPDEDNTPHYHALAFRVGTGGSDFERAGGVHWHASTTLWYRAADHERSVIAEVARTEDGEAEWVNPEVVDRSHLEPAHMMDCIDCHNRSAHKIPAPDAMIDDAIANDRIDRTLPYVKREGLRLLGATTPPREPAELAEMYATDGWFDQLATFYEEWYPEVAQTRADRIDAAIEELRRISTQVLYPEMHVSWATYPDNRGHAEIRGEPAGCFRCHTKLVNVETGERLPGGVGGSDCRACHSTEENLSARLGRDHDPLDDPACTFCHVSVPLGELEDRLKSRVEP